MLGLFRALLTASADSSRWAFSVTWPESQAGRCLLIGGFVLAVAAGAYSALQIGRHKYRVLALRLVALALLALILLRPSIDFVETERVRNRVVTLLDNSLSMTAKAGETSRGDLARKFLDRVRAQRPQLAETTDVQVLTFGRGVKQIGLDETASQYGPHDDATWLLPAVQQLGQGASAAVDRPLCGVVVVSDGAVNDQALSADDAKRRIIDEAKKLGVPFMCVLPGSGEGFRDITVRLIEHDSFAFVRNPWTVDVGVRADGYPAMRLPITLKQGRSLISTQVVATQGDGKEQTLRMRFAPRWAGQTSFSVAAPVQADECLAANNVVRVGTKVIRDKTRILHVCGRPSWDVRFLRRFFKQTPNVDLISFFILRQTDESHEVDRRDLSLIEFPTEELFTRELRSFDFVVFQNFDYRPYDIGRLRFQEFLENIRKYVLDGGGFVMIGGDLAFAQGGYAKSPLAEILPVLMDRQSDATHPGHFRLGLSPTGRAHPLTQLSLDPEENAAIWSGLPELQGCNVTSGLRPKASALAVHPSLSRNGQPAPIIATCEAGAGRVLAIMADALWHWNFVAAGETGTNRHYLRFWRNAMQWLIRAPELKRVRVLPSTDAAPPNSTIAVTVKALDRSYRPEPRRTVRVSILRTGETQPIVAKELTTGDQGTATLEFALRTPGIYEVHAADADADAGQGADGTHEDSAQVICRHGGEELTDLRADVGFLQQLANETDGWLVKLPRESARLDRFEPKQVERILGRRSIRLWDNLVCFLPLLGLLSAEWWLRRRSA